MNSYLTKNIESMKDFINLYFNVQNKYYIMLFLSKIYVKYYYKHNSYNIEYHGTKDDNIVIEIRYIDKAISVTEQTYCPLCF